MKKASFVIFSFILLISIMEFPVFSEGKPATLTVQINHDTGSALILPEIDENLNGKYIEVRIYKHGEIITQNVDELPTPLMWKMAGNGPFYYYGSPGKYFAVILEVAKKCTILADPVEFEIPVVSMPTEAPSTPVSTASMPAVTPDPTAFSTISATASPKTSTATQSPVLQTASAAGDSEDSPGNTAIIWICSGAAAVILVGTIIFAIAHRKKKS